MFPVSLMYTRVAVSLAVNCLYSMPQVQLTIQCLFRKHDRLIKDYVVTPIIPCDPHSLFGEEEDIMVPRTSLKERPIDNIRMIYGASLA